MSNQWTVPTAAQAPKGDPGALRSIATALTHAGSTTIDGRSGIEWIMASMTDWKGVARDQCNTAISAMSGALGQVGTTLKAASEAITAYASVLEHAQAQWSEAINNYRPFLYAEMYNPADTYSVIELHADGSIWSTTVWASEKAAEIALRACIADPGTGRPTTTEQVSPGWLSMFNDATSSVNSAKQKLINDLYSQQQELSLHTHALNHSSFGNVTYSLPLSGNPANDSYLPWAASTVQIQPGDNLWDIAKSLYGNGADYTKLVAANPNILHGDPNTIIQPGEILSFPTKGVVVAATGLAVLGTGSAVVTGMISSAEKASPPPAAVATASEPNPAGTATTVGGTTTTASQPTDIATSTLDEVYHSPGTTATIKPTQGSDLSPVSITQKTVGSPGVPGTGPTPETCKWEVSLPDLPPQTYPTTSAAEQALTAYFKTGVLPKA